MGQNARLIAHHGYGHSSRDTSNCTDSIAKEFILTGKLPDEPETACYANEKPYLYGMDKAKIASSENWDPVSDWRKHLEEMKLLGRHWENINKKRRLPDLCIALHSLTFLPRSRFSCLLDCLVRWEMTRWKVSVGDCYFLIIYSSILYMISKYTDFQLKSRAVISLIESFLFTFWTNGIPRDSVTSMPVSLQ